MRVLGFILSLGCLLNSCATPIQPTGGTADRSGISIIKTIPENKTLNFKGKTIELFFDKYPKRPTLKQALSIEPNLQIPYELKWGSKSVKIVFQENLPDSSTVIINVGTAFTDFGNNKMKEPFSMALSTYDQINSASIKGRVFSFSATSPIKGTKVYLFDYPYTRSAKALYIAETDSAGEFTLGYLKDGRFKVLYLDDRNRNRQWDSDREHAQVFPYEYIETDPDTSVYAGKMYVVEVDTTRPSVMGVGVLTSTRLRARFSKGIAFTPGEALPLLSETGDTLTLAYPVMNDPNVSATLFLEALNPLSESQTYIFNPISLSDDLGNLAKPARLAFTGSAQADTIRYTPQPLPKAIRIYPEDAIQIPYTKLHRSRLVADSLKVIMGERVIQAWPRVQLSDHRMIVQPDTLWPEGIKIQLRVYNPMRNDFQGIDVEVIGSDNVGEIELVMPGPVQEKGGYLYEVLAEKGELIRKGTFTDSVYVIDKVPNGDVNLRVVYDKNGNGKWDYGRVLPYEKPEPVFMRAKVPVKTRLTSSVPVEFEHD